MNKRFSILFLLMGCLFVLSACSIGSNDDSSSEDKTYKVGIDVTYPPFEYKDGDTYKGIDIDLIQAIADDQNFKIEFEAMDFSGIIPALQADQLDIAIAGMSITPEREKVVTFSDPYFEAGLILVVKDNNDDIKSVDDLKGERVAVKKGTTGAKYATDNADKLGIKVTQFNDSPAMFQEVKNGNAAALIEDYPVISYANKQQNLGLKLVGDRLNGDNYGIAVLKGENEDLMKKINTGLATLKDSGEYDEIVDRYLK
ncbi:MULTISPECIES: transporter substrate-binding domain-containing protein [unclassified Exiguobacterium]|uniref:transporter substrate-binding domain-containing protein n=1 Tax=unclassified Exiguobacterium TaxID=2644629 RepID=UPI001BE7DD87|nr:MULTISPECIES: transporter substrate-binding domain-containing protein [unclassified Exiguobacterium]